MNQSIFLLEDQILEDIFNNKIKVEFLQIKLIQKIENDPKIYEGKGIVKQSSDGELQLEVDLNHENNEAYWADFADILAPPELVAGQMLPKDNYYFMEGIDLTSQVWTADNVNIKKFLNAGKIFIQSTHLTKIKSKYSFEFFSGPSIRLMIPNPLKIPFNQIQNTVSERGLSACSLEIENGITANLRKKGGFLVMDINILNQAIKPAKQKIIESIGIALGAQLSPQAEIKRENSEVELSIFSLKQKNLRLRHLSPPIPADTRNDFRNFELFIKSFFSKIEEPYSQMTGYWFRILLSSSDSLENQALVITTAIEGMLKNTI